MRKLSPFGFTFSFDVLEVLEGETDVCSSVHSEMTGST
jgi:hypothetical protein